MKRAVLILPPPPGENSQVGQSVEALLSPRQPVRREENKCGLVGGLAQWPPQGKQAITVSPSANPPQIETLQRAFCPVFVRGVRRLERRRFAVRRGCGGRPRSEELVLTPLGP